MQFKFTNFKFFLAHKHMKSDPQAAVCLLIWISLTAELQTKLNLIPI